MRKNPGGFFKREGRPTDHEVLISRFIDRPLRPLFPKGFQNETQIIATVLSADNDNDPAILGMIGASAALTFSDAPFGGPIAGAKVGRIDGEFVLNPTHEELELILTSLLRGVRMPSSWWKGVQKRSRRQRSSRPFCLLIAP
jgi:polyribonucleotide nucleotidyltransferase